MGEHGGRSGLGIIVVDGFIEVWDRPGLGVEFDREAAAAHLQPGDEDFFA